MKKKILDLEQQLRDTRQAARTAIGAMEFAAFTFGAIRDAKWMAAMDPDPAVMGPRFLCDAEVKHLNKLAGELADRLGAE